MGKVPQARPYDIIRCVKDLQRAVASMQIRYPGLPTSAGWTPVPAFQNGWTDVGPPSGEGSPGADYDKIVGFFTDTDEWQDLTNGTVPSDKFAYIVTHWNIAGISGAIDSIRSTHPHAKLLAYQNIGGMIAGPHSYSRPTTMVTQEEASTHGDGSDSWYLHKASDNSIIVFDDFVYLQAANVSRSTWRNQATNHLSGIAADGFDGIFVDDCNMVPGHGFSAADPGHSSEFATDNAYRDAVVDAMTVIRNATRPLGLLLVPNVGVNPWETDPYAGFTAMLANDSFDGFVREFWTNWGSDTTYFNGSAWSTTCQMLADANTAGKFGLANNYPLTTPDHARSIRYGLASYYIYWDGTTASAFGYDDGRPTSAYSNYRKNIGTPTEAKQAVGQGWMRHYTGGVVVVNPGATGNQAFTLGGTYLDPTNAQVTSVTLAAMTGMVLLSTSLGSSDSGYAPSSYQVLASGSLVGLVIHAAAGTIADDTTLVVMTDSNLIPDHDQVLDVSVNSSGTALAGGTPQLIVRGNKTTSGKTPGSLTVKNLPTGTTRLHCIGGYYLGL